MFAQTHRVEVSKIWDNGSHSAFTSLIQFKGDYYCSFREGESHVFDKKGKAEGKVRIIKSSDGVHWESAALLSKSGYDLRDPKLSITPNGKLMVIIGGSIYEDRKLTGRIPQVSFSEDGHVFTDPAPVRIDESAGTGTDWIWRVTWKGEVGYAAMYSLIGEDKASLCLLATRDGVTYDQITQFYDMPDFPNEATIRFDVNGDMLMMVRREKGSQKGCWGRSSAPFTEWAWKEMDVRLGALILSCWRMGLSSWVPVRTTPPFQKPCCLPGKGARSFKRCMCSPRAAIPATRASSWRGISCG